MLRQRSLGVSPSVSRMFFAEAAMFAPDSGTIFGREVVPEVWRTSAMSPAAAGPGAPRVAPIGVAGRGGKHRRARRSLSPDEEPERQASPPPLPPPRSRRRRRTRARAPKVGQVELEFLRAVGRVERRGRGAGGDRHKGSRHLRAVRQHDRDAIVAAYAERVQARDRLARELSKGFKAERRAVRR